MAKKEVVYKPITDSVKTEYIEPSKKLLQNIFTKVFSSAKPIGKTQTVQNTTSTFYTVPEGKVFVITNASLTLQGDGAAIGGGQLKSLSDNSLLIALNNAGFGVDMSQTVAFNYLYPVVLMPLDTIIVISTSISIMSNANIFGFLVDLNEFNNA